MKLKVYLIGFGLIALGLFFQAGKAQAAEINACFCIDQTGIGKCISAADEVDCYKKTECFGHSPIADSPAWEQTAANCDAFLLKSNYGSGATGGSTQPSTPGTPPSPQGPKSTLSALITECGKAGTIENWNPDCKDITVFISLALQIVEFMFGIIGSIALLFFVYGGFVFILSQGNPEQITHGKAIIVSAVLGIIIAFSGYALVDFIGGVVGVKSEYRLY